MQEIDEKAGGANGTIYIYFADRDELVEKTFETAITQLSDRVEKAMVEGKSLEEKIRAAMMAKLSFFRENREFFRLYISLRLPEGDPQQQRRHKRNCEPQYRGSVCRLPGILAEVMDRGDILRLHSHMLAHFNVASSNTFGGEAVLEAHAPER